MSRSALLTLSTLGRHADLGTLVLRLFFAFVLIYGTQDNVFDGARMAEFRDFLHTNGFPQPLLGAYLSSYAQFTCGILIGLGALTRWASLVMMVNFLVALGMVHVGLPFSANISPLAMLVCAIFLVLHDPGPYALDNRLSQKSPRASAVPRASDH